MPPTPLRSGGKTESSQSPEALLISALLKQGQFTPERYNVTDEDIEAWSRLWTFCVEHQQVTKKAPPVSVVLGKFPDFEYNEDSELDWAVKEVLDASSSRKMRMGMFEAGQALKDANLAEAWGHIDAIPRPRQHVREPTNVFDHALLEDAFDVTRIEVPYSTLMDVTQGIGTGELWFYGARWAQGKSWLLCKQAVAAAKAGHHVAMLSYEMPTIKLARRLHRIMAEHDAELFRAIRRDDPLAYKQAVDVLADRTMGSIKILDTSYGGITSVNFVAQIAGDYGLIILDHIGLMKDAQGHRAGEDWRYHATISNILKEITMDSGTPILGAIQVNRAGDKTGATTPPKGSNAAGTDALGQDADVMVMHKRMSERVMVSAVEKNREGAQAKFYSHFDVERNQWGEISYEEAKEIGAMDGEINED